MSTQRLVKTFCDLVSTGSETGHERAFCIELEKALIEAGFEVERDEEAGKKCGSDGFNIYGYLPGEGEAEFEELCDFLREAKIERAGVFPYSPEEGTPAALMPDRCSTEEAQRRAELCMEIQAEIMDGFAETFIGRELDVLVMGREPDGTPWGRSEYDSPDIDSRVIFSGDAKPGDMVRVRIDSVDDGELIGEQI